MAPLFPHTMNAERRPSLQQRLVNVTNCDKLTIDRQGHFPRARRRAIQIGARVEMVARHVKPGAGARAGTKRNDLHRH